MMPETQDNTANLTPEAIAAWLAANPDFFRKNPDILEAMDPPEQRQGRKVADFQYYVAQRARADRDDILSEAQDIIETSRANMNNQTRIHRAVLRLLEARNFDEFIQIMTMDLTAMLDVDITALVIGADEKTIPSSNMNGIRFLTAGAIERQLNGQAVFLESNTKGREEIFGGGAKLVASQAFLRIEVSSDTPPALLAFGSRDPDLFAPGQATDQIQFLAHVIERMLALWLTL